MYSTQGFLTGQSNLHDELQTPQPNRKILDLQPHESQAKQMLLGHIEKICPSFNHRNIPTLKFLIFYFVATIARGTQQRC